MFRMIINKDSIRDISYEFQRLTTLLARCNYEVEIEARLFEFKENDTNFTIKNMKDIFYDVSQYINDKDKIIHTNWEFFYNKINKFIGYKGKSLWEFIPPEVLK
jgi:hypothetical protein